MKEEETAEGEMLAIDLVKRSFQVCATDRTGSGVHNRTVSRAKLEKLPEERRPCIMAMGFCELLGAPGAHRTLCGGPLAADSQHETIGATGVGYERHQAPEYGAHPVAVAHRLT
jgi:hypothetical protein